MKKIIFSALLAAVALCSCKTDTREYRNPTYPGYIMLVNNIAGYKIVSCKLALLFQIDEYIGAETDEEREKVHDKYFYNNYVSYDAESGVFNLRYSSYEVFVNTGGKRIGETGAEWTGWYQDNTDFVPCVKCIGENRYEVTYDEAYYPRNNDRYKVSVEVEILEALKRYRFMSVKMTGTCTSYNKSSSKGVFVIDGNATDLIWKEDRFCGGTIELTTENHGVVDNAKAEFSDGGDCMIWYGNCKDIYSSYFLEHGYDYYFMKE